MTKKTLTREQEFQIMKLVLDKFLLLGIFVIGLGFTMLVLDWSTTAFSFAVLISGALIMILFGLLMVKEYEFLDNKKK